jgi:hypothetical protein
VLAFQHDDGSVIGNPGEVEHDVVGGRAPNRVFTLLEEVQAGDGEPSCVGFQRCLVFGAESGERRHVVVLRGNRQGRSGDGHAQGEQAD